MPFYAYPNTNSDFDLDRINDKTNLLDNVSFVESFVIEEKTVKYKSIISKIHLAFKDCLRSLLKIIFIFAESVFRVESNDKTYIAFIPHGAFGDLMREKTLISEIQKMSPKSVVDIYWKVRVVKPWMKGLKNIRFFLHPKSLELTKNRYDMLYHIRDAGSLDMKIFIKNSKKEKKFPQKVILNLNNYQQDRPYSRQTFISYLKTKSGVDNVLDDKFIINYKKKSLEKFDIFPCMKYITLNYGARGGNDFRVWDKEKYSSMLSLLKKRVKDIKFVQVGLSEEKIQGCDIYTQKRTSIDELLSILSGSALHIDIDSGCSHMAYSLGIKGLVLFSTQGASLIGGYSDNINIASTVCNHCNLVFLGCSLNKPKAFCVNGISAEFAAEKAAQYLNDMIKT